MKRSVLVTALFALCTAGMVTTTLAADYPPTVPPPSNKIIPHELPTPAGPQALIFSNTHNYGSVIIDVRIYNNFAGDPTKYWWTYAVRNVSYDPNPGTSNGFSGFELALPVAVPDIADIVPQAPWFVNCCSGQPVEWDITNTNGLGVMPGNPGHFSFTTSPRLISASTGWFHTWQGDGQTDIINYPPNDAPEVPNVLEPIVPVQPTTWGSLKSLYNS
jgi:hypothetical protein